MTYLVCSFVSGMPSGRTNNFTESGRGLGHVNPTIFGSTVGYPSDSLASCQYFNRSLQPAVICWNTDSLQLKCIYRSVNF